MSSVHDRRIMMISTHGYVAPSTELGLPDTGGQIVYVLELSAALARYGWHVDILTRQFEDQVAIEAVADGVRIVRFPAGGNGLIRKEVMYRVIPEYVDNVLAWIAREGLRYDLIDSHYWDAGLAGMALQQRLGIPHVHTPHSLGDWKRENMDGDPAELEAQYQFERRILDERRIQHAADLVVATTPAQRAMLTAAPYGVSRERVEVIPPGYDDTRFFPVSAATRQAIKTDLGLEGPVALALGRIAANKGYDLLIRSFATVADRLPEARLVLAIGSTSPTDGEREQVDELRALAAELAISQQVVFRDHVPDDQLADHYRAADCFALSSRYEPFGMTAIEAMACGTPTVITTGGGLWELVTWGSDALYADPTDTEAFGHAMLTVLRDERIAERLGSAGSEWARSEYTWNGIARRLIDALDRRPSHDPVSIDHLHATTAPVRSRASSGPITTPARLL